MFVIEVIPLIRGTKLDTLSYYSSTPYEIGTFLSVPIRGKEKPAIVTAVHSVAESKSTLKTAAFALKKLPAQPEATCVPENVRLTAVALTQQYPSTVGAILYQLLPPEVRQGVYRYPRVSTLKHAEESTPRVLTARLSDRYITYRSHVRTILARRGSVLIVVPTSAHIERARQELAIGIEDRLVVFSPTNTEKERRAAYQAFEDTSLAKLIIATPSHAYLDRVDLLSIIIESEASEFYRNRERPYLDHRTALITHAKVTGRSLILGDILPRPETEHARREEFFSTEGETVKRINFTAPVTIVEQKDKPTPERPFSLFSNELTERINQTLSSRGHIFLYGARRGIAPVVACIDCGFIFRCPDSATPYSLIRTISKTGEEERWFVSSTSGKRVRASDTCPTCGSWRLRERGIGIQTVFDECTERFPGQKIFLFDRESVTTQAKATALMNTFYTERNAILLGTSAALPYVARRGVTLSAVVSLDATRANPTWRSDEQTLHLLFTLRDLSEKEVIIQTRTPIDTLLESVHTGMIEGFYTEELTLRQSLSYPPYAVFFLLSWQGSHEFVKKTEEEILKRTEGYSAHCYHSPLSSGQKIIRHALFRISPHDKMLPNFIELIRHFPPYIKIERDPSRIV
jgi:primosomal protein N'